MAAAAPRPVYLPWHPGGRWLPPWCPRAWQVPSGDLTGLVWRVTAPRGAAAPMVAGYAGALPSAAVPRLLVFGWCDFLGASGCRVLKSPLGSPAPPERGAGETRGLAPRHPIYKEVTSTGLFVVLR